MDGARLNLSHGTHDEHRERARLVRAVEAELGRPIALIADLQRPRIPLDDEPIRAALDGGPDWRARYAEFLETADELAANVSQPG